MSRCFQPDDALMSELPVCFPEHTQMYHHQHLQENWPETEGFDYAPNLGSEPDHTGDNLSRGVNELILDKQWGYSTPATSPKCMKQELQADTTAHGFSSQYHDAAAASQGFHPTTPSTAARFFSTSVQHLEPTTLNPLDISGWPLLNDALSTSAHAQASFPAAAHGIAPHEIPCGPFGLGQLNAGSGQSQIGLDLPMHHENYMMQETSASAGSLQPEPSFCRDWTKRVNLPPYERTEKDLNLLRWKKEGLSYKEIKIRGNYMEAESTLRGRYRNLIKAKDKRVRKPTWRAKDVELLQKAVQEQKSKAQNGNKKKISWKQVADYISAHDGSYQYGNATCKKRYELIQRESESDLWTDGSEAQDSSESVEAF